MPDIVYKNYEEKAVTRKQAVAYQSFGWIRSSDKPNLENYNKKKNRPEVVIKRKLDFSDNGALSNLEEQYLKLEKKKYKNKPILGIITFLLMLAFIVVGGLEIYFGISRALENQPANEETVDENGEGNVEDAKKALLAQESSEKDTNEENKEGENTQEGGFSIVAILDTINNDYLSVVTNLVDGKVDAESGEYVPGIIDNVASNLPAPINAYVNANLVVGVVALIIGIIFLIIFANVAGMKKKRAKKFAKMQNIRERAEEIVFNMRKNDISLMSRTQRKQYLWQSIITNAIRDAMPTEEGDDEDY